MTSDADLRAQAEAAVDGFLAKPAFADLVEDRDGLVETLHDYLRLKDSIWPWDWWGANNKLNELRDAFGDMAFAAEADPDVTPSDPDAAEIEERVRAHTEVRDDAYVDAVASLTLNVIILISTILPAGRIKQNPSSGATERLRLLIRENPAAFRIFAERLVSLRHVDISTPSVATANEIYEILSSALGELNKAVGLHRVLGVIFTGMTAGEIAQVVGYMLLSAVLRLVPWLGVVRYTMAVTQAVLHVREDLQKVEAAWPV